jgi:hypothetical protein
LDKRQPDASSVSCAFQKTNLKKKKKKKKKKKFSSPDNLQENRK